MIKKYLIVLSFIVVILSFSSCSNDEKPENQNYNNASVEAYLSAKANTVYQFTGTGSDYASYAYSYDYIYPEKNLYQRRVIVANEHMIEVLTTQDKSLVVLYADISQGYFHDMTDASKTASVCILKEPIAVGTGWVRTNLEGGEMMSEITAVGKEIDTPIGKVTAVEVKSTYPDSKDELFEYFAEGYGCVMSQKYIEDESGALTLSYTSSFSAIVENKEIELTVYNFIPNEDGSFDFDKRSLSYSTNDSFLAKTEEAVLGGSDASKAFFSDGLKINGISYSRTGSRIKVDLNQLPFAENLSAEKEQQYLACLTSDIGYYYSCASVCLTVNGAGYTSSNMQMGSSDYIDVKSAGDLGLDLNK